MRTVLCGIGGYGGWYLDHFLPDPERQPIAFTGFVDPAPERSRHLDAIRALGLPVYECLEAFYAHHDAELAILASPIPWHVPQALCALDHGSHVLTEKPLCATIQDARRLAEARDRADLVVNVGYQFAFFDMTHQFKRDILNGDWGRPLSFKGLTHWPRHRDYYRRSSWAGRVSDDGGRWVLDSPLNNATAHYLQLMLYLLGDQPETGAMPSRVRACLARAHEIENYDTGFLQAVTENGVDLFYAASHLGTRTRGPTYEFVFENGTVTGGPPEGGWHGVFCDGTSRHYAPPEGDPPEKVFDTVAAIREGRPPLCGIEAAMGQTLCINGAQESGWPVRDLDPRQVREVERNGHIFLELDGWPELLDDAFERADLPTCDWAQWGEWIEINNYDEFPSRPLS